jgi:hypothetical protein
MGVEFPPFEKSKRKCVGVIPGADYDKGLTFKIDSALQAHGIDHLVP